MFQQLRNLIANLFKRKGNAVRRGALRDSRPLADVARGATGFALLAKAARSIRARLVVLALIVLVPLMMDRVRLLEETRAVRIADIQTDAVSLARQSAQRQAEAVANTETVLKATSRLYVALLQRGGTCADFLDSVTVAPWIKTIAVTTASGKVICATDPTVMGINVGDRPYFQEALGGGGFALSDYIVARGTNKPVIIAAHAVSVNGREADAVVLMSVSLQWLANLKSSIDNSSFASTLVIDHGGALIAASDVFTRHIGQEFRQHALVKEMMSRREGTIRADDFTGERRIFAFTQIPNTRLHLAVGIAEGAALREIDRSITTAYVQFFLVALAIMLGAWVAGELMIVRPIRAFAGTAARLGKGELSARMQTGHLASEFAPLASAFNDMAVQLAGREHGLLADNNRLTVLATVDPVSGLANRRGFGSRIDYEWLRLSSEGGALGLLMIDLDHFKQYNDTYGHPEGDACLKAVGAVLGEVALSENAFAARYGGEEFLLLVPDADLPRVAEIGERLREAVADLNMSHSGSPCGVVTVSIGASAIAPDAASRPDLLIEAADAGLYAAKRRGRNQVVAHAPIRRTDSSPAQAAPNEAAAVSESTPLFPAK